MGVSDYGVQSRYTQPLRERGTRRLVATVLRENNRMLAMARALGFAQTASEDDKGVWCLTLEL